VEILCITYENGKMRPVEPVQGMGEGDKGGGEFNNDML
jgi:hypothetical protein